MKKNILLTTLLLCTIALSSFAQYSKLQRADETFARLAFSEAIPLYQDIITETPDNAYAMFKLANCYRLVNNPIEAVQWFEKGLKSGTGEPINNLYYGQALAQAGNYSTAIEAYEKFLTWFPGDKRGTQGIKSAKAALRMLSRPALFEVSNNFPFNTEYAEFSPAYAQGGLSFTSDRTAPFKIDYIYSWTGTPFLDAYLSKNDGQGSYSSPVLLGSNENTVYHDGSFAFSANGKLMAFTRNQYEPNLIGGKASESKQDGVVKLKLMMATWNDKANKWNDAQDVVFNSIEYSFAHPAFSPDNKTLYFTSDIPGGVGGTDIWKAAIKEDGSLDRPVNLGSDVNTLGQEMFPYIDKDNNLYFASNTHPGLGGLDVFRASYDAENDRFTNPFNLGAPINSSRDDFSLITDGTGQFGFFASNRAGGKGSDDIYGTKITGIFYQLKVLDAANNLPIEDASVTVSENGTEIDVAYTDANGILNFPVAKDKTYLFAVAAKNYKNNESNISTANVDAGITIYDQVKLICDLNSSVRGIVKEEKSGLPIKNATVTVKNLITGEEETTTTDITGGYRVSICSNTEYTVSATKEGYNTDSESFDTKGMTERTDKLVNLTLSGGEVPCSIEFNDIYFDFDKAVIRQDASYDLENMFTILSQSPELRVEIGAHTDSRANNMYNDLLSDRRATAVVKYLKKRGIKRSRMIAKGYGESQLKNNCSDGVECSEEEHQLNRRVEFKLIDKDNKVICESKSKQ